MKNRIKNILKAIVLISFAMFQFFGCKQIEDLKDSEKVAYITINNSLARSAMPELSIEKMKNFVLKGTFSGEEEQELGSWDDAESLKTAKIPINPGLWDFKLTAQQGGVSFYAVIEKKHIEVALNNLEFNLSVSSMDLQNGKGGISIKFKEIKNGGIEHADVYLYDLGGKLINKFYQGAERILDGLSYKYYMNFERSDIPAGTYFIDFKFYDKFGYVAAGFKLCFRGEYRELVNVTAGCTSLLTVESLDLSKTYNIYYHTNGGKVDSGYSIKYNYSPAESYELPTARIISKTGYAFVGWYIEEDFSGEPITNTFGMTGDKDFYAKWEPADVKYKISPCFQGVVHSDKYFGPCYAYYQVGKTGNYTAAVSKEFPGFTAKEFEQQQISYDGSTEVKINYDRNNVMVTLKLDGGNINGRTEDFVIFGKYGDTYTADDFYKDFGINYTVPEKSGVYFEAYNIDTDTDFFKKTSELEFTFPVSDTICTAEYSLLDYRFKGFKESKKIPTKELYSNLDSGTSSIEPFYIGETEVTYELWYKVQQWAISTYPEKYIYSKDNAGFENVIEKPSVDSMNKPICDISYLEVVLWCNAASEMCGLKPYYKITLEKSINETTLDLQEQNNLGYRLPSPAEWGYAARGGEYIPSDYYDDSINAYFDSSNKYYFYYNYENEKKRYFWSDTYAGTSDKDKLSEYAVLGDSDFIDSEPVKSRKPNSVGLYDMSGNIAEFIFSDCSNYYSRYIKDAYRSLMYITRCEHSKTQTSLKRFHEIGKDHYTGFRLARSVIE